MNNKLSITSRILVAFASGALIMVFFLPAWRIDLFAPQYPEGLTMNIWINGLTGQVDIINGLNHYIGMKKISADMFPEFKFLPYVVGFFIALGMAVAITGSRKLLMGYLALTVIGGALAMYDFYKWGYDYGHNLDSTAPIQVPGLSYQPPLFGHKRLLNFDAYSLPDVGGWVVIGASLLAFGVLFFELYHQRKAAKKTNPVLAVAAFFTMILFSSCNTAPEAFSYGKDMCHYCKMGIADPKFGAEIITVKGKVYKFDDVSCLHKFFKEATITENDIKQTVVINFNKENDFLNIHTSFFLVAPSIKSPMGSNAAAFSSRAMAEKNNTDKQGEIMNWQQLQKKL